jgi:hypothetical protein
MVALAGKQPRQTIASVSALKAAELRAALAAVKAAPRGQRDMRRLAVAYEALDEYTHPLHPYNPDLAAAFAAATNPSKEFERRAKSNGKAPMAGNGQVQDDRPGYARFTDSKTGGSLECNIGFLNGALKRNGKRALKLDIDTKKTGGAGKATRADRIAQLETKIGAPLPKTIMTLSPTSSDLAPEVGGHLHTEASADVDIVFHGPIDGVDCPNNIVAPGSEIDGRFYDVVPGLEFGEVESASAPQKLVDAISRKATAFDKAKGEAKVADGVELDSPENVAHATEWIVNRARHAVEGAGKHKTAVAVYQKLRDFALSHARAIELALLWSRLKCEPPYERERIEKIAFTVDASRQTEVGAATAAGVFGDLSPEQIEEMKKAEADRKAEPETNPGGGINFRDVRVKRAPYVMKGRLHRGETVQWFGPPGAGKSASLLSVMLAAAAAPPAGAMLAGCRVKRGLAIFAAYERAGETQDRLAAARKRLSLADDLPFVLLTRPPLLKDGKAAELVIEMIRHYEKLHGMPCSTFAVDTLTAARPGMGQSDDAEMSSLMNHLQHIRDTVCCCLPFIHHPTKADANNPRGSGVTTGHVDKEVVVNKGQIRMQKNNAGPDADALDLKIESVLMGEDEDGDPISVAYASVKPSRVGVEKAFGGADESSDESDVPERLRQAYDALSPLVATVASLPCRPNRYPLRSMTRSWPIWRSSERSAQPAGSPAASAGPLI